MGDVLRSDCQCDGVCCDGGAVCGRCFDAHYDPLGDDLSGGGFGRHSAGTAGNGVVSCPRDLLPTALPVNSTGFNLARFVGPAFAAGLLVIGSATTVFLCALIGFLAFAGSLYLIRNIPRQGDDLPANAQTVATKQVLRDVPASPIIFGVILLQLFQGILIRPASELFPAYAKNVFSGGETALGLLNAAVGLGAVAGALA